MRHISPEECIIVDSDELSHLLACQKLDSGVCGSVYNTACVVNGTEEPCAMKVVEEAFWYFQREIEVYEQMRGKSCIPIFYGAFAGMWVSGPLGVLVMELLDGTFDSFDAMDMQQKYLPFLFFFSHSHG